MLTQEEPAGQVPPARLSVSSLVSQASLGSTDGVFAFSPDGVFTEKSMGTDGKPLEDQTLTGLFLSGKFTQFANPDTAATVPDQTGAAGEDIALTYFPDPPCVFPPEDEEDPMADSRYRPSVQEYWKMHIKSYDSWPRVAQMRDIHQDFISLIAGGRLRSSTSILNKKVFVNVTANQVGVRGCPTTSELEKTGEVIESGQLVTVGEGEVKDGVRFWRLREMNGYVFESVDGTRVLQEALNMETGNWWYRVACCECIEVRQAPGYGNELRTGWVLSPGEMVTVGLRCRIGSSQFLLLRDGRGWVFTWKPILTAAGQLRAGHEAAMEECTTDLLEMGATQDFRRAIPPTDKVVEVGTWTYVVQKRPILCVGVKQHGTFLSPGDIIKVDKRVTASGSTARSQRLQERVWIRLLDGRGWVPIYGDDGMEQIKQQDPNDLTYPAWFSGNRDMDRPRSSWMTGFV